jgi:hypothetical protein
MKKFLIMAVAAVCCLAFTMPAAAKIDMGGMVTFDAYYYDLGGEAVAGGVRQNAVNAVDDLGRTYMDLYQPLNRMWMRYKSDDGNIGGYVQIRGGGANAAAGLAWYYGWIDWHFNPNFYLRIGRQTQAFAILSPPIGVGATIAPSLLFGFGNVHGGTSRDSIRAYIKFNDNVRMELQAMNPENNNEPGIAIPQPANIGGGNAPEENSIPRFDIAVPINIANFKIEPSFSWLTQEFDQVAAGNDDDFDIWGLALNVQAGFGPILFRGEVTYGENLGSGNYVGTNPGAASNVPFAGSGAAVDYTDTNGFRKIEDTEILAWWAALGVKFGPSTLWGVVGMQNTENDGDPALALVNDAAEHDLTRWAYGIRLDVKAAKGFKVIPEIAYYDNDDDADVGGAAGSVDYGDELMIGVRFQLSF